MIGLQFKGTVHNPVTGETHEVDEMEWPGTEYWDTALSINFSGKIVTAPEKDCST